MRFAIMLVAIVALWWQPAHATTFLIGGTLSGTISGSVACDIGFCGVEEPFTLKAALRLDPEFYSQAGDVYSFQYGPNSNAGIYEGSFRSIGSNIYQGILFRYARGNPACVGTLGIPNCAFLASTTDFTVVDESVAPVPEPSTWTMMLIGFGVIGFVVRCRRRRRLAIATCF